MATTQISCACGGVLIPLGRQGENGVTQIEFALTPFVEKHGEGTALLLHQRSRDAQPYPVAAERDGDKLIWTVSNADTAVSGIGKAEIQWYVGEKLAKSQIYSTTVAKALEKPSDTPPDPVKPWYEKLLAAIEEAKGDPEAIKKAVEQYLKDNPIVGGVSSVNDQTGDVHLTAEDIGALSPDNLQEATEAALLIAKKSGAFDGDPGEKGEKGDKGDTGEPGAKGDTGVTPSITIGTVETLPAGSSATASMGGTAESPVLNLGIPKGDKGADGSGGSGEGGGYDDSEIRAEIAELREEDSRLSESITEISDAVEIHKKTENIIDIEWTNGKFINPSSGKLSSYNPYSATSEYYDVVEDGKKTEIVFSVWLNNGTSVAFYDYNKQLIGNVVGEGTGTNVINVIGSSKNIENTRYLRFTTLTDKINETVIKRVSAFKLSGIIEDVEKLKSRNRLTGRTIIFDGDSICEAVTESNGGWAKRIGTSNNMDWYNVGISGATITGNTNATHQLSRDIDNVISTYQDIDYYIFDGGTNDADKLRKVEGGLGNLNVKDFGGNYDTTTFTGAFETLIFKVINAYPHAKVGYIIPQKMGRTLIYGYTSDGDNNTNHRRRFFERAIEICQKWGIPYIDLWNGSLLCPALVAHYDNAKTAEENAIEGKMYVDGQHLTEHGYNFITPMIESWIDTL